MKGGGEGGREGGGEGEGEGEGRGEGRGENSRISDSLFSLVNHLILISACRNLSSKSQLSQT